MKKFALILILAIPFAHASEVDCEINGALTIEQIDFCDYEMMLHNLMDEYLLLLVNPNVDLMDKAFGAGRLNHEMLKVVSGACGLDDSFDLCRDLDKAVKYNDVSFFMVLHDD